MNNPVKAIVTDAGDPSVGIFPVSWRIECPFHKDMDSEEIEIFRKALKSLYSDFCEGHIIVEFDFEYEHPDYLNNQTTNL